MVILMAFVRRRIMIRATWKQETRTFDDVDSRQRIEDMYKHASRNSDGFMYERSIGCNTELRYEKGSGSTLYGIAELRYPKKGQPAFEAHTHGNAGLKMATQSARHPQGTLGVSSRDTEWVKLSIGGVLTNPRYIVEPNIIIRLNFDSGGNFAGLSKYPRWR